MLTSAAAAAAAEHASCRHRRRLLRRSPLHGHNWLPLLAAVFLDLQ
jgi:hypothetical protein